MKAIVSNKIFVDDASREAYEWCDEHLRIDNPDYYKKLNLGKWVGGTPQHILLYERDGNRLTLPFGCFRDFYIKFKDKCTFEPRFSPIRHTSYEGDINLYPYQEKAVNEALGKRSGVMVMPCGSGKGLPIDAKICTPTGWKRNGDLQIGDTVVGSDGKATRVTGIFDRGKVDAYKITFSDGVETICDKDHLWTVQKQSQRYESGNWFVENAENIYKHYQNMKCRSQYLYIPIVEPVNYYCWNEKDLTINPWLLGFLLGDGCFQKSMITMSTNEDDLREKVVDIIGRDYGACEWLSYKSKYDYRFCGGYVFHDIKTLNLYCKHSYEKFVPAEYIYNSVEVRLAVLQGLFDADGHISNGTTFEYSTTSKQLADNIVEIVESLGGTAKVRTKTPTYTYNGEKRIGRTAYRIFFKLYKFKPFTSKKHTAVYKERTNYKKAYRIIKKIEPCEPIISRCITVDAPDELYVTKHYVVTHNTQSALALIQRIGGKCLWLTHTQDLLNQSLKRAQSLMSADYGTITGGKVNIGNGITFATIQTMVNLDLDQYRDVWDIIIVDECHKAVGSPTRVMQFYKVLSALTARYKYGLTATPKRADGIEKSMFALLGGISTIVTKDEVKDTTCPVEVRQIQTGYFPDCDAVLSGDGTINYAELVDNLISDEKRFEFIMNEIGKIPKGEPIMVLANRVAYLEKMAKVYMLRNYGCAVCLSTMSNSKSGKARRKASLEALNTGSISAIFATYQLAKEGLDIPNLRYLVLATPEKDPTTIEQSAGRVARKADGKDKGIILDFVDSFGMFKGWANKRKNLYKKNDYNVLT